MESQLKAARLILEKHKSFIRYIVVGVINTGVDFLIFSLFNGFFSLNLETSQTAGYSAGILNSFLMNKFWTFEDKAVKKTPIQAVKFIVINLISLGFSIYGIKLLNQDAGLNVYISKGLITFLTLVINFIGYKLWVFKSKTKINGSNS